MDNISSILSPINIKAAVKSWLMEDLSSFDYSSYIFKNNNSVSSILLLEEGILAGCPIVNAVFDQLNCTVVWRHDEGDYIENVPTEVAEVTGTVKDIAQAERLALNILTRACGIATVSHRMNSMLKEVGWKGFMAGTRKTTPGYRLVEKYAMLVGGADTHRYDLSSMIMLKDNHIVASGSITKAVKASRQVGGFSVKIEVECQNQEEAEEAALAGADIVMLDNMKPSCLGPVAASLKEKFPHLLLEASGGITEATVMDYALPSIDIISCSRLSQGYATLDLSLQLNVE